MTRPNRSIIAFAGGLIHREYLLIGGCWCNVPNRRGALCRIVKIVTMIKLQKTDLFVPSGIIAASRVDMILFW